MTRTYECMFLIDNDAVRAGWRDAKGVVQGLVKKHGGEVVTARRWDERRLAYPIRHKNRATYLLAYCSMEPTRLEGLRRDLDISETVLRYLLLTTDEVPAKERELSQAEESADFVFPEPPPDDVPEVAEEEAEEPEAKKKEEEGAKEPESEEGKKAGEAKGEDEKDEKGEKKEASGEEAEPQPVAAERSGEEG